MTTLEAAMADNSRLDAFEGIDVLGAGIEIPGAAGGLRDAMKIEPQQFHHGQRLYVVLECTVEKVRHDPIRSDDELLGLRRVHVLAADAATFVDGALVGEAIDTQKRKIAMAKEAAAGVGRLPTGEDAEAMADAHTDGLHAGGLVPGCPSCDEERDTAAAEKAALDAVQNTPTPISGRRSRGAKA